MPAETAVDSTFFATLAFDDARVINRAMASNLELKATLLNRLLIFESIVIPTQDFGILLALEQWFGLDQMLGMIKAGTIRFQRRRDMLSIGGATYELMTSRIDIEQSIARGRTPELWQRAVFDTCDEALHAQLEVSFPRLSKKEKKDVFSTVKKATTVVNVAKIAHEVVIPETMTDLSTNPELIKIKNQRAPDVVGSLANLPDVASNQIKYVGVPHPIEYSDVVLAIAQANFEIYAAYKEQQSEFILPDKSREFLNSKLTASAHPEAKIRDLDSVLDLCRLPDIGKAVAAGSVHLSKYTALRNGSTGVKFRRWLRSANPQDNRDVEREYVSAITAQSPGDLPTVKVLKSVVNLAIGTTSPIAGVGAELGGSFFVDQWLKGYRPSMFIDDARSLFK